MKEASLEDGVQWEAGREVGGGAYDQSVLHI